MYTFDQLKEDVKKEAEALRAHATKEELGRLDFATLDPSKVRLCVYGQLTGICDSYRAVELIGACASTYLKGWPEEISCVTIANSYEYGANWSPIELYIYQPEAKNANLIAFLKGESETLEL